MDAELSHDSRDIPRPVAKLAQADFVTDSRYMPGRSCDYSGYRIFVSQAASAAARVLLRLPLHESTSTLHQAGFRLAEVPIHFHDRTASVSKIPRLEIIRGMRKLLQLASSRLLRRAMAAPSRQLTISCRTCGSDLVAEAAAEPDKRMLKCLVAVPSSRCPDYAFARRSREAAASPPHSGVKSLVFSLPRSVLGIRET